MINQLKVTTVSIVVFFLTLTLPLTGYAKNNINIRVGLLMDASQTSISASSSTPVEGLTSNGWQTLGNLNAKKALTVRYSANMLSILGQRVQRIRVKAPLSSKQSSLVFADNHWYRGTIEIFPGIKGKGLTVVNILPLNEYLYGVVPSEMPSSWHIEALKAQAIAARTYTLKHLGSFKKFGFDVMDTVQSQVYKGAEGESSNSNKAIDQTRGQVMVYNREPIHAYYHSTSGGQTESGHALWAPFPYLKAVRDFDHKSPKFIWQQTISQTDMKKGLAKMDLHLGRIRRIEPLNRSQTGRIKKIRVIGERGTRTVKAMTFRLKLKINSTFFNVGGLDSRGRLIADNSWQFPSKFHFVGRGWGHAMGMSQWGARQMALNGSNHQQILKHYYTGIQIKHFRHLNLHFARGH